MPVPPVNAVQPEYVTVGGSQTSVIYSGQVVPSLLSAPLAVAGGSDILFWSGAGRLNRLTIHQYVGTGNIPIVFYDSATPTSGGPFVASGHKIVAVYPNAAATASGTVQTLPANPTDFNIPFSSGLCVNSRSGQPGFTVSFNSEVSRQ